MINNTNNSNTFNSSPSQVELDFLAALLEPADATYPWNPADQESEAYFNELEQQFLSDDLWQEDELNKRSQDFSSQLDNLWSTHNVDTASKSHNLRQILMASLQEAFTVVPQGWLNTIAQNAAEIFSSQQSIGEQLVQCVQDMLPSWGADDLLVLARPYAYAMRSGEPQCPKAMITKLGNREWTSLSEVEQAKVSLAISYYALNELNSFQSES
ncbi:hypothetical protein NIES37_09700 [Tolypothrix tenuis PCC 7101]|uniref:Uncharacterized protein n=1 Tax=Tolypothrix tenuis PCC 7101 TaxID=231146 RepID=A0A1Z4MUD2_9CYAN|nr:hypothetical protein [Aulosira sp. FACHB-113]BAY97033.1 hypothetical protein NIES37_09700 [Tolypothrix tenuis PCC 7101]BAZ72459.1 hypothetical protein NIES50_10130 [Aulosira laxa NIES-50]